ncbi:hypothetical protein [Saccharothrix lopnurensis]|uniref:Fibronectin type-III domain-containing protein n=1 Tax=Saccharothrix lopnurensis TaxID=1670621 RepID=A0ABW1P0Q1_9PSEU
MERRKLIALVGGIALLGGTVALLRDESAPPPPPVFERFLADGVEHVPDAHEPGAPTDLELTALDRTSLRASWTAAGGLGHGGFEVRWNGGTRLVQGTETELTDLDVNADVAVEVRAVDGLGNRSGPATATAVPRMAYDAAPEDGLFEPVDRFDGPESLSPRRWRVLTATKPYDPRGASTDCLGRRPFNGGRLEVACDLLELQSNVPLTLGEPHPGDGAVGRAVLTTDGPLTSDGEVAIALLPEPFQDLAALGDGVPPGAVVLRVTSTAVRFDVGAGVPATGGVVPAAGTFTLPSSGVRHRWELRVLPDAVVALRDGVALAGAPVAVPWRVAHPRLVFRESRHTLLDSFGTGGVPAGPEPASVVALGRGGVDLGTATPAQLAGGTSVRVVATLLVGSGAPATLEFGSLSAPATPMPPEGDWSYETVVYADFPLEGTDELRSVRLPTDDTGYLAGVHLVVADGLDARRPLPRVTDRPSPVPEVPVPTVTVVREGDVARVVVELADPTAREVAAVKGVEVDFDGERIATLPTNGSAGGRHEFALRLDDVPTGGHDVVARVLPVDGRGEVRQAQHSFQIRPL